MSKTSESNKTETKRLPYAKTWGESNTKCRVIISCGQSPIPVVYDSSDRRWLVNDDGTRFEFLQETGKDSTEAKRLPYSRVTKTRD